MSTPEDFTLSPNYYFEVEKPNYLKYILYSDTDSMFMQLLDSNQLKKILKELVGTDKLDKESVKKLDEEYIQPLSKELNNTLKNIWQNLILTRANVTNEEFNKLDFKTEMVLDFILYGDKKKKYVYRILKEKEKTFDEPEIKIKGFEFTRSDASQFVKDLQISLINAIINIEDYNTLVKKVKEILLEFQNKLKKAVQDIDIEYIGIPKNWSPREYKKLPSYVYGAFFYNTFIQDKIRPGTKGLTIPIEYIKHKFIKFYKEYLNQIKIRKFNQYQLNLFEPNTLNFILEKVRFIFIPPEYNKERIIEFFNTAGIKISYTSLYESSYKTKVELFIKLIQKKQAENKNKTLFSKK